MPESNQSWFAESSDTAAVPPQNFTEPPNQQEAVTTGCQKGAQQ